MHIKYRLQNGVYSVSASMCNLNKHPITQPRVRYMIYLLWGQIVVRVLHLKLQRRMQYIGADWYQIYLTQWPLGYTTSIFELGIFNRISRVDISSICCEIALTELTRNVARLPQMIRQHWFRLWLGAVRPEPMLARFYDAILLCRSDVFLCITRWEYNYVSL